MDTKSEQFREEMGAQWSNVTWRVTVPAKLSLWILAILDWEQEERQLRMDNLDVGSKVEGSRRQTFSAEKFDTTKEAIGKW